MRRYLVMEESAAPGELNAIFSNIENNGAPWQFSQEDRTLWSDGKVEVPVMADLLAKGEKPEYLLWVGSAGAFDDRYKQVSVAFAKVLNHLGISYAVLGAEESSSGDVARRAGNEMLFQMQAMMNIELLDGYEVKKIITCDPHAYNTLKNEYPDLEGEYEVIHHSQLMRDLMKEGKLSLTGDSLSGKKITFHDPCYLGRANGEYKAPREVLEALGSTVEMKRNKSFALCCGAGGGQMFKEAEKGEKEVFIERCEDALETGADIIATACPYCMVMMTDGLKYKNKEEEISNYDIAELVAQNLGL
jgi:Fe-S oxidoreductase